MGWWPPPPMFWVRLHRSLACMWALLMIPSLLWWKESLIWVIIMSCYANFAGSMASLQAARADQNSPTCEDIQKLNARVVELLRRVPERDGHSDMDWKILALMRRLRDPD